MVEEKGKGIEVFLEEMKKGYLEMAEINLELVEELFALEEEVAKRYDLTEVT